MALTKPPYPLIYGRADQVIPVRIKNSAGTVNLDLTDKTVTAAITYGSPEEVIAVTPTIDDIIIGQVNVPITAMDTAAIGSGETASLEISVWSAGDILYGRDIVPLIVVRG